MNAINNAVPSDDPGHALEVTGPTIDGMEEFFEDCTERDLEKSLTIKQAVHYYNMPPREIRAGIKSGQIKALRLGGQNGRKWRIFPQGIPQHLADRYASTMPPIEPDDPSFLPAFATGISSPVPAPDSNDILDQKVTVRDLLADMQGAIADLEEKLEAAAFRNGYLEAQVAGLEDRLKLITLRQPPAPWWTRMFSFLAAGKTCQAAGFRQ